MEDVLILRQEEPPVFVPDPAYAEDDDFENEIGDEGMINLDNIQDLEICYTYDEMSFLNATHTNFKTPGCLYGLTYGSVRPYWK